MQKKRRAIRPKNKVDVREHANRLLIRSQVLKFYRSY